MKIEEIINDRSFQKFLQKKPNIKKPTIQNYAYSLKLYCEANNKTLHEIIKEQHTEQRSRIQDGVIIEYNPNFSKIDDYQYNYITYLQEKGNKNISIKNHLLRTNIVLKSLDVKLSNMPEFYDDSADWYVLTKSEIKYVLNFVKPSYRAMITLMASTGMRRSDVLNLKIKDYMKYTYSYHGCDELEDFLVKAEDDMIGFFDYIPQKTRKHNIRHKTCNSMESNKHILFMLRERQKLINRRNKRTGESIKMSKDDFLFSSSFNQYKKSLTVNTVSMQFNRFNKKLVEERKSILDYKLKNGSISCETYNQLLAETPVFNAHALRKFFITKVAMFCTNPRVISLLEGHSTLLPTDVNYVDVRSIDDLVRSEYLKLLSEVSFDGVDVDLTVLKRNKDLLEENRRQRELLEEQEVRYGELLCRTDELSRVQREQEESIRRLLRSTRLGELL